MEWISIKDKLPNEGDLVLVLTDMRPTRKDKMLCLSGRLIWPQRVCLYNRLNSEMELMFLDENFYSYKPTHWMPLPNQPERVKRSDIGNDEAVL